VESSTVWERESKEQLALGRNPCSPLARWKGNYRKYNLWWKKLHRTQKKKKGLLLTKKGKDLGEGVLIKKKTSDILALIRKAAEKHEEPANFWGAESAKRAQGRKGATP